MSTHLVVPQGRLVGAVGGLNGFLERRSPVAHPYLLQKTRRDISRMLPPVPPEVLPDSVPSQVMELVPDTSSLVTSTTKGLTSRPGHQPPRP